MTVSMFEQAAAAGVLPEAAPQPPTQAQESCDVSWVDPLSGRRLAATLHAKILTLDERLQVGRAAGRLSGGVPWAQLPPEAALLIYAVAWAAVAVADRPDWLERACSDVDFAAGLLSWLQDHDRRFRSGSGSPSDAGAGEPRFSFAPRAVTAAGR